MKVYELEENKIYLISGNDLRYKIVNKKLYFYSTPSKSWVLSDVSYNWLVNKEFEEFNKCVDWFKIPKGTKVQARDNENEEWSNFYFLGYHSGRDLKFEVTTVREDDSYVDIYMEDGRSSYRFCRIHPSIEILDEWYEDGE